MVSFIYLYIPLYCLCGSNYAYYEHYLTWEHIDEL